MDNVIIAKKFELGRVVRRTDHCLNGGQVDAGTLGRVIALESNCFARVEWTTGASFRYNEDCLQRELQVLDSIWPVVGMNIVGEGGRKGRISATSLISYSVKYFAVQGDAVYDMPVGRGDTLWERRAIVAALEWAQRTNQGIGGLVDNAPTPQYTPPTLTKLDVVDVIEKLNRENEKLRAATERIPCDHEVTIKLLRTDNARLAENASMYERRLGMEALACLKLKQELKEAYEQLGKLKFKR